MLIKCWKTNEQRGQQQKSFINKIDKYDLAFLTETHIGYDTNIPIIGNFICHIVCRPKAKANNRYFGGIAILIKKELKLHFKILKNT